MLRLPLRVGFPGEGAHTCEAERKADGFEADFRRGPVADKDWMSE